MQPSQRQYSCVPSKMGSCGAGDELVALGGGQAEGVAGFFQREEELGAVGVFPGAGVGGAAAQADDDGQVLDADRALVLARAAGGAFEGGFQETGCRLPGCEVARLAALAELGEQRDFGVRAEGVEVGARAEDDLFGVEDLAGGGGGAVLGAAAALDAAVGLQRDDLGEVFAGDEAEVFDVLVGRERRDGGEAVALEEDGDGREDEVQVLGVRDERKEDEQREGVRPPESFERGVVAGEEGGEVGDHQQEDEQGDDAGLVGDFLAEPDGADEEAADEEARRSRWRPAAPTRRRRRSRSGRSRLSGGRKPRRRPSGEVVERDQGEGEESPEDEGVGDAGQRALADDFGLAEDFPDEVADAAGDGAEREAEVFAGGEDGAEDGGEADRRRARRRRRRGPAGGRFRRGRSAGVRRASHRDDTARRDKGN